MQVLFSPQFSEKTIEYTFYKDTVRAKTEAETVFFDFRKVEEGKSYQVNHELVLSVERIDGELRLTLLDFICEDCPEKQKFPEMSTVTESEFELPDDAIKAKMVATAVVDNAKDKTIEELKERLERAEAQANNAVQALLEMGDVLADIMG